MKVLAPLDVRTKKGDEIRENMRVTTRQVMQLVGGRCGVRDRYVLLVSTKT